MSDLVCACGCGGLVVSKNKGARFIHGHRARLSKPTPFWENVAKSDGDGCWEWTAGRGKVGYGMASYRGGRWYAHRLSWTLTVGEIPAGTWVLHRCDNRLCVRPDHLFLGTAADNTADMLTKRRGLVGEKNGHARLTADVVRFCRAAYAAGGITHRELAARFGVATVTMTNAITGERWGWVDG